MDNLLDPLEEDELQVSGNDDPLDKVKSVCLDCGRVNGEHDAGCDLYIDHVLDHLHLL